RIFRRRAEQADVAVAGAGRGFQLWGFRVRIGPRGQLGHRRGLAFLVGRAISSARIRRGHYMSIQRHENGPRMSRVVVHNGTVYLAGLTADATVGQSVGEQTKEILDKIDSLLKQGGTDKSKLLQAVIWLQDIRVVDEFNKVWDAWVVPGQTPARACIEARLQSPAKMIEIQVTAAQ